MRTKRGAVVAWVPRARVEAPWWARTVDLAIVAVLGSVVVVAHADPTVAGTVAAMVFAALRWPNHTAPRPPSDFHDHE